jgi:murein DD-endopeptidase MepM/ murein hydrolase activator NlpD
MGEFSSFIEKIKGADFRGTNFIEYNDLGGEIYISFQTLLYFLDEYINLSSKGKSISKIDWESDKPFYAFSTSISTNLKKFYLHNDYIGNTDGSIDVNGIFTFNSFRTFTNSTFSSTNTDLEKDAGNPPALSLFPQIGNINYIYLNIGYLSELISKGDVDNKISLKKFIQDICDDMNKSLGGINDFKITTDPDDNTITIIDYNQKRIKGLLPSENQLTTLKVQGLGSFITSISAQSSITPEIATMVSIGAQANGNQTGEEATSFSRLSKGIVDRIYTEKVVKNTPTSSISQNNNDGFESTLEAYRDIIFLQKTVEGSKSKISLSSDDKNNLDNIPVDLYKKCLGGFTVSNQSSTSFIPIKLDLTLSGISGIKIFQRFNISSDLLPYTYKDNYNFITTGVSHEINNNNQWFTKISSLIALKEEPLNQTSSFYVEIGEILTPPTSNETFNLNKPGATGTINVSSDQINKAISKTGKTADEIKTEQNKFPSQISGYNVTSGLFRNSSGDYHGGFDLGTPEGTQITLKKDVIFRGNKTNPGGYGTYVLIEYNGKGIVLGHLSENYKGTAKIGQVIKAGSLIGKTGNTGRSSRPHLHFHVYNTPNLGDKHVLPLQYALDLLTLKK